MFLAANMSVIPTVSTDAHNDSILLQSACNPVRMLLLNKTAYTYMKGMYVALK